MNETINTVLNELPAFLNTLHFIRADWFYAFIPLILFLLLSFNTTLNDKNWQSVIDPQLMPFVLSKSNGKRRRYPLLLIFIASSLCITALAGPVYKKLPQPVYREQSSLVVLLDLSQSMNATDIKASRLSRAKLELLDLLKTRKNGQTALIVYAADAFVVTPLTDDNATIANLVPSLETGMMPAQGSNLSNALAKTLSLFTQAGIINGNILVLTDGIHQRNEKAIIKIASQGHHLSIFGIGTTAGSPIPLIDSATGGFLLNSNGAIVVPKLQPNKLQQYALQGGGLYTSLRADDSDINKLARLFESKKLAQDKDNSIQDNDSQTNDINADLWQEEGHWLLLPLLFFAALWARKGWLAGIVFFLLSVVQPLSQPLHAAPMDTEHLWLSVDQKAMQAFDAGDNIKAAKNFTLPEWKASAHYRHGDFEAAAKALEKTDSSDGFYNRGNALTRQGKYEDAIKAYDKALDLDKDNDDATYNREQVKQVLKKQQQEQQQNQDQDGQKQEGEEQEKNEQENSNEDQQPSEEKEGQSQDQDSENKNADPQSDAKEKPSEQQRKAEEDELKQRDAESEAKQQAEQQEEYEKDKKQQNEQNEDKESDNKEQDQEQQKAENPSVENIESEEKPAEIEINPMEASITEEEKATEQWLKRIPDDPGGLLRRKFHYQYKQIPNQRDEKEPW